MTQAKHCQENRQFASALLTPDEMGLADQRAISLGTSGLALMEAAGRAVANAVTLRWPLCAVTVLCGPGNNGGDGFVVARHLATAGWPVRLALMGSIDALSGDAAHHAGLWGGGIDAFSPDVLEGAELVIDAIFGAGLSRPIEGEAFRMIRALIARKIPVCAVDVPSGLDGATGMVMGIAAPAALTITFFRKKPGHLLFPGRVLCGSIILSDIGTPAGVLHEIAPQTFENSPALWLERYPWPKPDDHKYKRGAVLVLGGTETTGASRLAALAALRVGAGLVALAAPPQVWDVYATALTSVIVHKFEGLAGFEALLADARRNVIVVGPGAGIGALTRDYALAALASERAVVLDADGITSFADVPEKLFHAINGQCVLTPHEGEFSRLFDCNGERLQRARAAAAQCGAVVLLKGADTVIAAPDGRAVINTNAPAQLATGGSGDVLTGLIAGLIAQGLGAFDAACAAAWLHGEAASAFGLGLIAEDLPAMLPGVLQQLNNQIGNAL